MPSAPSSPSPDSGSVGSRKSRNVLVAGNIANIMKVYDL